MATADQLKGLIRSSAAGDNATFYGIVLQIAANELQSGHVKLAGELRKLVEGAKSDKRAGFAKPVGYAQPSSDLAGLLTVAYPKTRLSDMAFADPLRARIDRVLTEYRASERLRSHGFSPMRKLLLVGVPGTGKTMTAAALAGELEMPLFSIRLDSLITSFMGETARKLRVVFDEIKATRGVYFFDEFDALGSDRSSNNDVGEIRRVLNSFLQMLEQDDSDSMIVCATNFVGMLDRALFRRFDAVLEYSLPDGEIALRVMQGRLALLDTSTIDWQQAATCAKGLSHAEMVAACEQAAKNAILDQKTSVRNSELESAIQERFSHRA